MRKIVILETYKWETIIVVSPDKIVIRKSRHDRKNYMTMLKSVDRNIKVNEVWSGSLIGNRLQLKSNNKSKIIIYFDKKTNLITDYFRDGRVHFAKEKR